MVSVDKGETDQLQPLLNVPVLREMKRLMGLGHWLLVKRVGQRPENYCLKMRPKKASWIWIKLVPIQLPSN